MPQSPVVRNGEILPLTSSRFLAALVVVFYHTAYPFVPALERVPVFSQIAEHGNFAVDFFFILSGYILARNYNERKYDKATFYLARFARVYPLYIFALLIDLPFFLLHRIHSDGPHAGLKIGLTVAAYLPMLQAWLTPLGKVWCMPGWSLSCEAFFYGIFPFVSKKNSNVLFGVSLGLWLAFAVLVVLVYPHAGTDLRLVLSWNPLLHVPSFLLGISCVNLNAMHKRLLGICAVASVVGIFLSQPVAPVPLLALFVLILSRLTYGPVFSGKGMVLLGRASYAMYLVHWPIWRYFGILFGRKPGEFEFAGNSFGLWAAYLLTVILVSIAAHLWIETPLRLYITARWKARPRAVIAAPSF